MKIKEIIGGKVSMGWFYNLKISLKLLIGFATIILIATAIGIVGIVNLQEINQEDNELYENDVLGLQYAADANGQFQRIRLNSSKMLLQEEKDAILESTNKVSEHITNLEEALKKYETTIIVEEDKSIFDNALTLWEKYNSSLKSAIELAELGNMQEAKIILDNSYGTIDALNDSFENMFAHNSKKAKEKMTAIAGWLIHLLF